MFRDSIKVMDDNDVILHRTIPVYSSYFGICLKRHSVPTAIMPCFIQIDLQPTTEQKISSTNAPELSVSMFIVT